MTKCTCHVITPAASAATGEHHYTSCPMYMAATDPADTDPIGRIAQWLTEARIAGYNDREIAAMLVAGTDEISGEADTATALADQLDEMASNEEQTSPIDEMSEQTQTVWYSRTMTQSCELTVTDDQLAIVTAGREANPELYDQTIQELVDQGIEKADDEPIEFAQADMWIEDQDGNEQMTLWSV